MKALNNQSGVGLIEVMIALVVTAIGLLGLAALQGKAQRAEMESYQRSQALLLLQDMASRLRANRTERANYVTNDAGCTNTTTLAGKDLCQWHEALSGTSEKLSGKDVGTIINGHGCITGSGNVFTVTVAWQGLGEVTQNISNTCGNSAITNAKLRRTMSIPVRFVDLNPP